MTRDLVYCVGRRRLEVSKPDANYLIRILLGDRETVLANLVIEPPEIAKLRTTLTKLSRLR